MERDGQGSVVVEQPESISAAASAAMIFHLVEEPKEMEGADNFVIRLPFPLLKYDAELENSYFKGVPPSETVRNHQP